ncbi:hypothetical protein ACWGOE_07350 [Leucobacter chromiiresistens]
MTNQETREQDVDVSRSEIVALLRQLAGSPDSITPGGARDKISRAAALLDGGLTAEQIEAGAAAYYAQWESSRTWPEVAKAWPAVAQEWRDDVRPILEAGLSVPASADPADEHDDTEEREAESEDHAATVTGKPDEHDRDHMGICGNCGAGLNAMDLLDGERPCAASVAGGREKLIAEAEAWVREQLPPSPWADSHVVHRLIVALGGGGR